MMMNGLLDLTLLCFVLGVASVMPFAPQRATIGSRIRPPALETAETKPATRLTLSKKSEDGGLLQPGLDLLLNFDDVVDDFFNKRMGNGEIFYGKRKFNPSGKVEGKYNGMGLTDRQRIDETREHRELRMEQRRLKEEEEFEKRNKRE